MVKGVLDAAERHNYTTPELEELRMRFIKSTGCRGCHRLFWGRRHERSVRKATRPAVARRGARLNVPDER